MWQWLLILLLAMNLDKNIFADEHRLTSVGPTSETEKNLLWQEGRISFGKGDYPESARLLQRLVDRYPSTTGYLEAHLLLGITRIRMQQDEQAIKPLQYFVSASGKSPEAFRARLLLGQSFYKTGKYHEAILNAEEVLNAKHQSSVPQEVYLEVHLLKAWALISLNKDPHATTVLAAFQKTRTTQKDALSLEAQAERIEMEIKIRACNRLPGKTPLPEENLIDQIRRRSICLLEAVTIFMKVINTEDPLWVEDAEKALGLAFQKYEKACQTPPLPPLHLTQEETKKFRKEIIALLLQTYRETNENAQQLLESLLPTVSNPMKLHVHQLLSQLRTSTKL